MIGEGLARPERFELPTYSSGGCRSIQLSYGRAPNLLSLQPPGTVIKPGEQRVAEELDVPFESHEPAGQSKIQLLQSRFQNGCGFLQLLLLL